MNEVQSRTRVLLDEGVEGNPKCVHGPMLRFSRENANGARFEFFGCSACRSRRECPGAISGTEMEFQEENLRTHREKYARRLKETPQFFCSSCNILCQDEVEHSTCNINKFQKDDLNYPTKILSPNDRDKTEAQYFFSDSSVRELIKILTDINCNKIICLGTPRLHENVRQSAGFDSILLDFDDRLMTFYSPDEFLRYNMFNHYFFCGEQSRNTFSKFLKNDSKRDKVCLIVDPPFGCRTEALSFTLKRIQLEYLTLNKDILPIIWVFPYFMEKYVNKSMPEMAMLDYKVNYTNHTSYNETGRFGSPVRLFTNIIPKLIRFDEGFKFCSKCQMYTRLDNPHCNICQSCPSKNGSIYKHCPLCATCVKPYYVHCADCNRCAQVEGHDCEEYQKNAFCWICDEKGHVEKSCPVIPRKTLKVKKKSSSARICAICRKSNHNERNCRDRTRLLPSSVE